MALAFKPSAEQTGSAIGRAIGMFPVHKLVGGPVHEPSVFAEANITAEELQREFRLLCLCAAAHGIRSSGLSTDVSKAVLRGLHAWIQEQPEPDAAFFSGNLIEATSAYAEAAKEDADNPPPVGEFSAIEAALADRLLARGTESEARIRACALLAIAAPKALWSAQIQAAVTMLGDAQLITVQ
jgi:hypothetical protein